MAKPPRKPRPKPNIPPAGPQYKQLIERGDKSRRVLIAGRVLEIYGAGGGYNDIVAEFGKTPRNPYTGKQLSTAELYEWACRAYLSDEGKEQGLTRILSEMEAIAHSDMGDYVTWGVEQHRDPETGLVEHRSYVKLRDWSELTPMQRRCVQEIRQTEQGVVIKLWPKMDALKALGGHFGLQTSTQRVEAKVQVSLEELILESMQPTTIDITPTEAK